jgi:DNA-directed RNA polymerase subunit RPC12/RpoP
MPTNESNFIQPPPGYQAVPSALEGITVFAPLPKADPTAAPAAYHCPNCGAPTRFDVAAGGVECEHCGYVAGVQSQHVGRQAGQAEFTLENLEESRRGWGVARRQLHCEACGAELELADNAITATCPFCASSQVNLRQAPGDHMRPRFLVPFKIEAADCQQRARVWLGRGWYHPKALASSAAIQPFTGVYLPFWTFSARVDASWRAEVGYERTERYYDAGSKSWQTRIHIDWRWESGQAQASYSDLLVEGSSHTSQVLLKRIQPFGLDALVTYSPDYLAGWQAQVYDIPLETAWDQGKAIMRERSKDQCRKSIHSSHVRNFSMAADFNDEAWRFILLPVYLTAYRYNERVFQVLVNGQTGAIGGQKPVDWWKIWLVIAAMLLPGLAAGLAGLLGSQTGPGIFFIAFVLFVLGVVGAVVLYRGALSSEEA